MSLSPNPGDAGWGMESSGRSCSLPIRNEAAVERLEKASNTTTCAPLYAAQARLNARGFRSPPPKKKTNKKKQKKKKQRKTRPPRLSPGAAAPQSEAVCQRRGERPSISIESIAYSDSHRRLESFVVRSPIWPKTSGATGGYTENHLYGVCVCPIPAATTR